MTPEQQREIARLYDDTGTPTAEIRERFGLGESTLYRVLQKQGVSLRGRATSASAGAGAGKPVTGAGPRSRGRPRRDISVRTQLQRVSRTAVSLSGAAREFRVRFEGQRIFEARDIHDALRQAEALGATSIIEVTRLA
jgi:transposase-like protein